MDADALSGRAAIVTGGGGGIGSATARQLAAAGASVMICGRTAASLESVVEVITADRGRAASHVCDLSEPDQIEQLVAATVEAFGSIDIVVNNAAFIEMTLLEDVSVAEFDKTFALNVRAPMLLAADALPYLRESSSPSIVNIISVAVEMGGSTMGLYRASKVALAGLTKVMAKEWGRDGIRVNAVSPGKVDSANDNVGDDMVELAKMATPLGRLAEPDEIADVICFLAGDQSSYITGSTLTVDGGVVP